MGVECRLYETSDGNVRCLVCQHKCLIPEGERGICRARINSSQLLAVFIEAASDISLWEIGMLIAKGRVKPDAEMQTFISRVVTAYNLLVLPITPKIAALANSDAEFVHGDPADRIITATALVHKAPLVTCDRNLRGIKGLKTIW